MLGLKLNHVSKRGHIMGMMMTQIYVVLWRHLATMGFNRVYLHMLFMTYCTVDLCKPAIFMKVHSVDRVLNPVLA